METAKMANMANSLRLLIELQNIDSRLDELEESKRVIPARIAESEQRLEEAEESLREEEERLRELEREQRRLEREREFVNAELEKYQKQLYEVKTNKEFQALQHEIEGRKNKREELEDEILIRMTSIDDVGEKVREGAKNLVELRKRTQNELRKLRKEQNAVEEEVMAKQRGRKQLVAKIDGKLIKSYERIKASKGLAVVSVVKEACGGCFRKIPPQRIQEIRGREKLVTCENCGRILVLDNGELRSRPSQSLPK